MAWLLASPGHQLPWYWLSKIGRSWSSMREDFNNLLYLCVGERYKLKCPFLFQCYFFTVEFGLCKQESGLRVYGAGLLSSVDELRVRNCNICDNFCCLSLNTLGTKWPPICKRHFQVNFLLWKCWHFDPNFTKFVPWGYIVNKPALIQVMVSHQTGEPFNC